MADDVARRYTILLWQFRTSMILNDSKSNGVEIRIICKPCSRIPQETSLLETLTKSSALKCPESQDMISNSMQSPRGSPFLAKALQFVFIVWSTWAEEHYCFFPTCAKSSPSAHFSSFRIFTRRGYKLLSSQVPRTSSKCLVLTQPLYPMPF